MPTFIAVQGLFRVVIIQAVFVGLLLGGWWLWCPVPVSKPISPDLGSAPLDIALRRQTRLNPHWSRWKAASGRILVTALGRRTRLNPDRPLVNEWHDVDEHQWAWSALDTLNEHRLIASDPIVFFRNTYFRSKRTLTFYECAIVISRAAARIEELETGKEEGSQVPVVTAEDYLLLKRLIVAFTPELKAIGYFDKRSQDSRPFAGVPKTQ